jgi:hypothetical protein
MALDKKACERLLALHRLMVGSDKPHKREAAHKKLGELLNRHGYTWGDLPKLLASALPPEDPYGDEERASNAANVAGANKADFGALEPAIYLIEKHLDVKPNEALTIALWILHSHVFNQFDITPRLFLTSPVPGCGKTEVLKLIEILGSKTKRTGNISAAAAYRLIEQRCPTLLIDEGENQGARKNPVLVSVFNDGYGRGGTVDRVIEGEYKEFPVFAPMAIAAIGASGTLPTTTLSRCVIIRMTRKIKELEPIPTGGKFTKDPELILAYQTIQNWAATVKLNTRPDIPKQLTNRMADIWRPLLAAAADFGWGDRAREAALIYAKHFFDEDAAVILLYDIRTIFNHTGAARITSEALVSALLETEGSMISWTEWCGVQGDQQPRKLTQGAMARLLHRFQIRSRKIRFKDRTLWGYAREQFTAAWASYCQETGTPAQESNVKYLDGRRR